VSAVDGGLFNRFLGNRRLLGDRRRRGCNRFGLRLGGCHLHGVMSLGSSDGLGCNCLAVGGGIDFFLCLVVRIGLFLQVAEDVVQHKVAVWLLG
jgi:hypothetical protein